MKHKKPRFTYANVASTVALALVVGGGTAYAAGLVGTDDLAKGAVTSPKLAKSAVTTAKVRNGSLRLTDLAARPFTDVVTRSTSFTFDGEAAGHLVEHTTSCEAGETAVSGGHHVSALTVDVPISRPANAAGGLPASGQAAQGWHVLARQTSGGSYATITVWALCAS